MLLDGWVCRSALQSAMLVAQHHRAAVKAWASSTAGGSSGSSVRQVALGQTYYADPLNLSPLSHMPYLFVADARRMLGDSSSEAGAEVGVAASSSALLLIRLACHAGSTLCQVQDPCHAGTA